MFLFDRKKSLRDIGILEGFTDRHSHILPGVDDGIQTMDDSLAVLAYYESVGMKEVWLTPHIMEDIPNKIDKLKERYEKLLSKYEGNLKLHLAAENMIDNLFVKRLAANELLPYGDKGDQLLVETSYMQPPIGFRNILQDIKAAGYTPVLAHPERYQYMDADYYDALHAQGILFQMNITSAVGGYGVSPQARALHLLEKGYYTYYGTDVHSLHAIRHMFERKALKKKEAAFVLDNRENR